MGLFAVAMVLAMAGMGEAVIGGERVSREQVPYYVYLRFEYSGLCGFPYCFQHCGGVLIDPLHVLTAAHCLHLVPGLNMEDPDGWTVSNTLSGMESRGIGGQSTRPTKIDASPYYRRDSAASDLAVFTLRKTLKNVVPIEVSRLDPPANSWARIVGGGMYAPGPGQLQNSNRVLATNVLMTYCGQTGIDRRRTQGALCSSGRHETSRTMSAAPCSGDSGGPLVYDNKLIGIISQSMCRSSTRNIGALYTPVMLTGNYNWINQMVGGNLPGSQGSSEGAARPREEAQSNAPPADGAQAAPYWREEWRGSTLIVTWNPRTHQAPPVGPAFRVLESRPGMLALQRN